MPVATTDANRLLSHTALDDQYVALLAAQNRAQQAISQKSAQVLNQYLPDYLPAKARQNFINTISQSVAHHAIRELAQRPNMDIEAYAAAEHQAVEQAVKTAQETYQAFANLFSPEQQQKLTNELQDTLPPEEAKQAAQAAYQADQLEASEQLGWQSPEQLADTILQKLAAKEKEEQTETDFGVTRQELTQILKSLPTQVANLPVPEQIDQALQSSLKEQLPPAIAEQLGQELKEHRPLIHQFVNQSVKPLPRQGPYQPYQFGLDKQTYRQARSLGVNPLALAYLKRGFPASHRQLPNYLRKEVGRIEKLITDPFNPAHKLNFPAQLAAARLAPQILLAQKYYFPLYQAHQTALAKANKFLAAPYDFYRTASDKYDQFRQEYQQFKAQAPWGWLIAPRQRLKLSWFNTTNSVKKSTRHIIVKNKNLRRLGARFRLARIKTKAFLEKPKAFLGKWGPGGIRKRFKGFVIRKSAAAALKFGNWLAKKALTQGLGKLLVSAGTLALESASIIGLPLAFLQIGFSFAIAALKKLRRQIKDQQMGQTTATAAGKVLQAILGGLKALGMLAVGSLWGLAGGLGGAFIGFMVGLSLGGPIGAIIGTVVGFFGGSFILGSIGAFIGWNWMTIAAIPATVGAILFGPAGILGGGLIGTGAAAPANTAAVVGLGAVSTSAVFSKLQTDLVSSAFFLPDYGTEYGPDTPSPTQNAANCTGEQTPLSFANSASSPIAKRAWQIVNNLYQGFWCYWNWSKDDYPELFDEARYNQNPFPSYADANTANLFWCTWLIIKGYNETGHQLPLADPDGNSMLNSQIMQNYFDSQGKFISNSAGILRKISPGDVIFIQNESPGAPNRTNHVAIVYEVNQDVVIAIESNAPNKFTPYTINSNGSIQAYGLLKVVGFGQP